MGQLITLGQNIELGPFHFTIIRVLVAIGILRVMINGEKIVGSRTGLDRILICFGIWAICCSVFHKDIFATLVNRLGLAYDCLGLYFLLRVFIRDAEDTLLLCRIVIIALVPVAIEMLSETVTGRNAFSFFGGVLEQCEVRGGKVRAQGPFGHSILAGTVGAVCLPMAALFWKRNRKLAILGLITTSAIVVTSRSSGPIMTAGVAICGLATWKVRDHMRAIRWGAVCAVAGLSMMMNAPVYYLLARIDLTGSSTSWYRAALIESAFKHINEWWLGGTDYTRHWMVTGVAWSEDQSDITNNYIKMGVLGGLPLMLLLIGILTVGFVCVGRALRLNEEAPAEERFVIWTLGSILFAHAATMLSVSYFDQSIVFFYLVLAAIGSVYAAALEEARQTSEAGDAAMDAASEALPDYG